MRRRNAGLKAVGTRDIVAGSSRGTAAATKTDGIEETVTSTESNLNDVQYYNKEQVISTDSDTYNPTTHISSAMCINKLLFIQGRHIS